MLYITNNSVKHQSFAYTQLNRQRLLNLTIQFSISNLFVNSLNDKHFHLIHISGATTPGQSGSGSNGNEGVLLIPKSSSITEASIFVLPPTWQGLTQGYFIVGVEEAEVVHEPWLVRSWTMLVIGSQNVMWTMLAVPNFPARMPGDLAGHWFAKPEDLVICLSLILHLSQSSPTGEVGHSTS